MKKISSFLPLVILFFIFYSCKKETEKFSSATIADYAPLETGKYITYKLDSLVYTHFGTRDTIISYEVKYLIDSLITDNLGRPAYRIFRFIRKQNPDAWISSGTLMAINTQGSLEFVENNMRFVKLELPVVNARTWKGNEFIDTHSLNSEFQYMDEWDYTYDSVGKPAIIGAFNFDNTLTVHQCDEIFGFPDIDTSFSQVNFAEEKYAKGVGLVYRKFFHNEFQPDPPPGVYADGSYGVTLTMIDHN